MSWMGCWFWWVACGFLSLVVAIDACFGFSVAYCVLVVVLSVWCCLVVAFGCLCASLL